MLHRVRFFVFLFVGINNNNGSNNYTVKHAS